MSLSRLTALKRAIAAGGILTEKLDFHMPIYVRGELTRLTQSQFANIAYEVTNEAFTVYNELGSLFDEAVYKNALIGRLKNTNAEVQIDVMFQNFHKSYFMDAVVAGGGIFELKAVKELNSNHRSQLLNYLLLAGMNHGKLINFAPLHVEHEFVNTKLTFADRTNFAVNDREWSETEGFGQSEKNLLLEILHDWGTGLDCTLYQDVLFHFLDRKDRVFKEVGVFQNGKLIAQQIMPLCGEATAIHLTSFQNEDFNFLQQLIRLIHTTSLKSAQWVNVGRKEVTFKTLHISVHNISV